MFVYVLDVDFAIYVTRSVDVFFITEPAEAGSPLSPSPGFGEHTTFARAESNLKKSSTWRWAFRPGKNIEHIRNQSVSLCPRRSYFSLLIGRCGGFNLYNAL